MEEKLNAGFFKDLAKSLMFELSDEEANDIVNEFEVLNNQMALLDAVDTEGVEPMVYPFEDETYYLREDEVSHTCTQDEALKNVEKKLEGHFILPKVVK